MKTITDTAKNKHYEYQYSEFVNYAETRIKRQKHKSSSEIVNEYRTEWSGTKSKKQALDFARNGWDAGLKQLAEIKDDLTIGSGHEWVPSVAGSAVNMGAYLQGQPESMFAFSDKTNYNREEVTLFARLDYASGVEGAAALNYAKQLSDIAKRLQEKYNLRVVCRFYGEFENNIRLTTDVVIKELDEPFILNSIAFAFHPSFFRRIYFSHLESYEFNTPGYGRIVDTDKRIVTEDGSKYVNVPHLGNLNNKGHIRPRSIKSNFKFQ